MSLTTVRNPTQLVTTSTPASRASWSGRLTLGPLIVPVKAYPALVVPNQGPLHQIHVGCGERISQRKVCPKHGEVAAEEIGKAFQFAPHDQLTFSAEELDALAPPDDETIRIEHLLPSDKFDYALLSGRSLYLAPTHAAGAAAYNTAIEVLGTTPHWAIGSMVLSAQRRTIAVRVEAKRLLLFVLHAAEYRRAYPGLHFESAAVPPAELRALEKSLLPLHKSFAWDDYRDEGADRLNRLIATKLATRNSRTAKPPRGAPQPAKPTVAVARRGRAA